MTDVSVTLRPPYLCPSKGHKHGVSIQSSINLGDTLLQITREWKTAKTWFLARLFIYQSSIVSQILDFIHGMVTIFSFHHMTGENRELGLNFHYLFCPLTALNLITKYVKHKKKYFPNFDYIEWPLDLIAQDADYSTPCVFGSSSRNASTGTEGIN